MVHDDPTGRPSSSGPCIYWNGEFCVATDFFDQADISCFHDGNCDGFGTCRGCTKYDQGGLKMGTSDGQGNQTQTPFNLLVYNLRARLKTCCNWDGAPVDFVKNITLNKPVPDFIPAGEDPDFSIGEKTTLCIIAEAAPWQDTFTEENPTPYGCNGAKAECPFYTGPKFTEVVDAKMDLGNRITAKQIMELRFYSSNWKAFNDPRAVWESRFSQPDIWAWVLDPESEKNLPGSGLFDESANPLIQRVTIENLKTDTPQFVVEPAVTIATGSPVIGGPPDFPDLIRELFLLSSTLEVLWPPNTGPKKPLVRSTFTPQDNFIYLSVKTNSARPLYAVNLTKNPQGSTPNDIFIKDMLRDKPEDVSLAFVSGLPQKTLSVELEYGGSTSKLNHIRVFLESGDAGGTLLTSDVYIQHDFHHAHVAQTSFVDSYGHTMVDPWINHFTDMKITADILDLTKNTEVHDVLWNTFASNGRKTMYATEVQKEVSSEDETSVSWEPIGCGYIAVTFLKNVINRVYPWKAWGQDAKGAELFVKVDRTKNDSLSQDESTLVTMDMVFASTKGTVIPPNVAIFKTPGNTAFRPFDPKEDILRVRYAYTEYKQGPIAAGDLTELKFPSDSDRIIEAMPYGVEFDSGSLTVEGTFIKAGEVKLSSCNDVMGDCYRRKSKENELLARQVFVAGGVGEETIKKNFDMVDECAEEFNNLHKASKFEDGSPVSFNSASSRLQDIHLLEGSQHYTVFLKDNAGRPIGIKNVAFLTQSAMVQARDVEIRYKWGGQAQHFPIQDGMILLAIFAAPMFSTTNRLIRLIQEYDPECGDHKESLTGQSGFGAFSLDADKHGAMWYPYVRCLTPQYHANSSLFENPTKYVDIVEGFGNGATGHRRDYWERMRVWDKYMPATINYIHNLGCFWSERDTNLNVNPPFIFTGYTKIRSLHPLGAYATDRESIRVSRHWEKRNLNVREETITQGDEGLSINLTQDFFDLLYDEEGKINQGAELETPVWVHINDGLSVVLVASEQRVHPFGNILMGRTGTHSMSESFSEERLDLSSVVEERDLTSSSDRSEDGSKIYLANGTALNVEAGFLEETPGSDIRWVFKSSSPETVWAWLPEVPAPKRTAPLISGLFLDNPKSIFFKKNIRPATHVIEGEHTIKYAPHTFDDLGNIATSASLTLDEGPPLYISQTDGKVFILSGEVSPYDVSEHEGEDYQFVLHGKGPAGAGILADARGLQRYEVGGNKFATLAGVSINLTFDISELPYVVTEIRSIERLEEEAELLDGVLGEYNADTIAPVSTTAINFKGHYFVESIELDFLYGGDTDVPAVSIVGVEKGKTAEVQLFDKTLYLQGAGLVEGTPHAKDFVVNLRLSSLTIDLGARKVGRKMDLQNIRITMRDHILREEKVILYEPKVQVSTGNVGTHHPSDLEFYFQRTFPDFAKDYVSGQIPLGGLGQSPTAIAGTSLKYSTRRIKDILPHFEFTDTDRFPYNNIDFSKIPGFTTLTGPGGVARFIGAPVQTSSKGWTMYTNDHSDDPYASLDPPSGFRGRAFEDGQEELYRQGSELLGDKITVYSSFWHPTEQDFFSKAGVNLEEYSWTLQMKSTVAPINRVFQHENYGCHSSATTEYLDGAVHKLENWQARGAWIYSCNPGFNWACLTTVMSKCTSFLFSEYGTSEYLDNNVTGRFTYHMAFPPREYGSWKAAGLYNLDYSGGIWGGFSPTTPLQAQHGFLPPDVGGPLGAGPFFGLSVILGISN